MLVKAPGFGVTFIFSPINHKEIDLSGPNEIARVLKSARGRQTRSERCSVGRTQPAVADFEDGRRRPQLSAGSP